MRDAVAELVRDGDTVAIEGFTHLICFAAGHEIIRQRRRDLTLARMTPDVIYDQMIGAGVASKLIFSWLGNPGVGSLHAVRRRVEHDDPAPLEVEEYSHFGMVCRYMAGAANLPFFPLRSYYESDIPTVNPKIRPLVSPYEDGTEVYSFHLDRSDDNALWLFELYRDEDALAEHSSTDAIKTLLTALPGLLSEPPLMVFATPVDAKGFDV